MQINNNFTLEHKNGYWNVGLLKAAEDTGKVYKASTKTYPTLKQATLSLVDNSVDESIVAEVASKVYNEYQLEQSRLFFVDKKRAADRNVKRKQDTQL